MIAPLHHRLEKRIRAHALICFLALLINRVMRLRLKQSGAALSPASALQALARVQHHAVKIGAQEYRGITRQTDATATLCEQLKIPLPN